MSDNQSGIDLEKDQKPQGQRRYVVFASARLLSQHCRKFWKKIDIRISSRRRKLSLATKVICVLAVLVAFIWALLVLALIPHVISAKPIISNGYEQIVSTWVEPGSPNFNISTWPKDLSSGIKPVSVHSHNDYLQRVPLFDALAVGCEGVEADVWLVEGELLVAHTSDSLTRNRTLRSLYIDPLVQILEQQNKNIPANAVPHGVFALNETQPLTLLVEMKADAFATWPVLYQQLEPLRTRDWLTYYNGTDLVHRPITVVGTGLTPFSLVLSATANGTNKTDTRLLRRDIFFDAPLTNLSSGLYNATNSLYASSSLGDAVGKIHFGSLNNRQLDTIDTQTKLASELGLKARYWDTPSWPISWRNGIWIQLTEHGVGMLNADDVVPASRWNWDWCTVLGVNVCG